MKKKLIPVLSLLITTLLLVNTLVAQQMIKVPMHDSNWSIEADDHKFENFLGAESLYLPVGFAHLNEVNFQNGIIEFDISFPESRGFPGITFRRQNETTYEEFYMRPHQSGNPDANQYTPVFNGVAGWQLYYGEGHAAAFKYNFDDWNHVKIIIKDTAGEVYINDMEKPLYQIYDLKLGNVSGPISLKGHAKSHFANFSYSQDPNPEFSQPTKKLKPSEDNVVTNFLVSNSIEADKIMTKISLEIGKLSSLKWTKQTCEFNGTLNVARVAKKSTTENVALVKFVIESEQDQTKMLEFGYSDVAQVFVNNKSVYLGNNTFRSRDYRYLGTIGYFDAIFIELNKGENTIVFALMESFGGWGMKARLDNIDGISLR